MNSDYEMPQFYHKIQQPLENAKFITVWRLVLSRNLEDRSNLLHNSFSKGKPQQKAKRG